MFVVLSLRRSLSSAVQRRVLLNDFYYRTLQIETGERGKRVEEWPREVIYLGVMHLSLIVQRNHAPPHVSTSLVRMR